MNIPIRHQGSLRVRVAVVVFLAFAVAIWVVHQSYHSIATPTSLIKVRLALNPVPLAALPIIAEKGSYWKSAGLDVQMFSFPSGKASLDAVLSGGADFATAAETPIMHAALAGISPAVLATIATSQDDCKVCYRRDLGINDPRDISGKKVATVFGTSAEFFMDSFLRQHGVKREQVSALSMKPPEMVNALLRGDISAFFIWEPYPLKASKLDPNVQIFLGGNIYTETFQIVSRRDYANKNPEACRRLLRALINAEHHSSRDEKQATDMVAAFIQLAPTEVSAIWKNFRFHVGLNSDLVSLMQREAEWARSSQESQPGTADFHTLLWPDPLRQVASDRVAVPR
jgi:ABC-type nitrate/sulfonate/bicarbonate transport system substrate-binding protein